VIRRGEIYYVNFDPVRGSEQGGTRPALIIQNEVGNEYSSTTIVAPMSSSGGREYDVRVPVNSRASGLSGRSWVLCDQIRAISVERLGRRAGRLPLDEMEQVDEAIRISLGLRSSSL